jgi:positive phototaxis protein PixI
MILIPGTSSLKQVGEREDQIQYLRFHLHPDTNAMLPVAQLTEVLSIPLGQIVAIPHLPAWVMGVYNWRGEILWMVDLGHLLGLTPWYQQGMTASHHRALVLHSGQGNKRDQGQMLGLVVSGVEDIEWCDPAQIQSPPASAVTASLAPFLRGYWLKNGEMLVTLDGEAILAAMPH